jgi:toxin YxiD
MIRLPTNWMEQQISHWTVRLVFGVLLLCAVGCGQSDEGRSQQDRPAGDAGKSAKYAPEDGSYDLSKDEDRGGHTLRKHVGRTDQELLERLQHERNISAASTWTDRTAAEQTVGEALRFNREKILSWQSRGYPRANLALHFNAHRVIGRTIRQGESQSSACSEAVIVLKAGSGVNFIVLTTYPEARD